MDHDTCDVDNERKSVNMHGTQEEVNRPNSSNVAQGQGTTVISVQISNCSIHRELSINTSQDIDNKAPQNSPRGRTKSDSSDDSTKGQQPDYSEPNKIRELRIVLVGQTGVGKSACGNTILGRREFESVLSAAPVTTQSQKATAEVDGRDVHVVDTPGLFDTDKNMSDELMKEIGKCIRLSSPGPHVILVVIKLGNFAKEEQESVKRIQETFGEHSSKYTMVLFTHGEGLGNTTIEEFISQSEPLREFTAQCHGGYLVFRNKEPKNPSQVTELLQKIDKMVTRNRGGCYTIEMYQEAEAAMEKKKQKLKEAKKPKDRRIVLVGKTGVGKSACGNTILGREAFESELRPASVTGESKKATAEVDERNVHIVDTPGLFDTDKNMSDELMKEIAKCICLSSPGPHVILVVIKLGNFAKEEQESVKKIQQTFGEHAAKYTLVLFTHGEGLGNTTIEEFISKNEPLREFTAQCHGGYHVFRNKDPENCSQVTELLQKIDKMVTLNGGGYYTNERLHQEAEAAIEKEKQRLKEPKKTKDLRIVLVGKIGVGKSACGNTILGREEFRSEFSPYYVTAQCKKARAEVDGRDVYVIDTPGLLDTPHVMSDELMKEIAKCIYLSSPGPHVILVVIQLGRFTKEEQKSVKKIQEIFGEHATKYTMVLFSHAEGLENTTIDDFIVQSEPLKEFTAQCHGRYHVFSNKDPENHSQVTELLQKIDKMVTLNGGAYYTNEMFQEAEAAIENEKQRILKETEEKRKKEVEKLNQMEKNKRELEKALEDLQRAEEEKARQRAESDNIWIKKIDKCIIL